MEEKKEDVLINTNEAPEEEEEEEDFEECDLTVGIQEQFYSSRFSDMTIVTRFREFKVHRVVVCGQSAYFFRLFKGNRTETADNIIRLPDDDPRAVEAMVHYFYGFEYEGKQSDPDSISEMLLHVRTYHVAEKYGIPRLKEEVAGNFEESVEYCWDDDDFPTAISEIYTGTVEDCELRNIVVEIAHDHLGALNKKEAFVRVMTEVPGFSADLVQYMASRSDGLEVRNCSQCHHDWKMDQPEQNQPFWCPFCGKKWHFGNTDLL
ncbi:hypothetical protein ASPZODRAFT_18648 [Penicilliopsis zonata CBS 506.65]|uniref:BTB domain-containing protein n=1 Tax=Penicilliopsis zonata CBS 506.65 TaxID=1073090 RepID=A0A1L9SBE1_9EURO|nr:hypothetical protein ASPZODRAFT_18648 [Penicilliopsis zonata CBS 506.65]OJJ44456.1 hypothetical protein ASPZODRAFT_18648 [Penicilliopsis zonata CBS 506.65]